MYSIIKVEWFDEKKGIGCGTSPGKNEIFLNAMNIMNKGIFKNMKSGDVVLGYVLLSGGNCHAKEIYLLDVKKLRSDIESSIGVDGISEKTLELDNYKLVDEFVFVYGENALEEYYLSA